MNDILTTTTPRICNPDFVCLQMQAFHNAGQEEQVEVHNKWNQFRMMDGLEQAQAYELAGYFEFTARELVSQWPIEISKTNKFNWSFETGLFPLIRRCFTKGAVRAGTLGHIINEAYDAFFVIENDEDMHQLVTNPKIDAEAEFLAMLSDKLVLKYGPQSDGNK